MGNANETNDLNWEVGNMFDSPMQEDLNLLDAILFNMRQRLKRFEEIYQKYECEHVKVKPACTHGEKTYLPPGWNYKKDGNKFCRDCGEEL